MNRRLALASAVLALGALSGCSSGAATSPVSTAASASPTVTSQQISEIIAADNANKQFYKDISAFYPELQLPSIVSAATTSCTNLDNGYDIIRIVTDVAAIDDLTFKQALFVVSTGVKDYCPQNKAKALKALRANGYDG